MEPGKWGGIQRGWRGAPRDEPQSPWCPSRHTKGLSRGGGGRAVPQCSGTQGIISLEGLGVGNISKGSRRRQLAAERPQTIQQPSASPQRQRRRTAERRDHDAPDGNLKPKTELDLSACLREAQVGGLRMPSPQDRGET